MVFNCTLPHTLAVKGQGRHEFEGICRLYVDGAQRRHNPTVKYSPLKHWLAVARCQSTLGLASSMFDPVSSRAPPKMLYTLSPPCPAVLL